MLHTYGTWDDKLDFDEQVLEVVLPLGLHPSSLQSHQPRRATELKMRIMLQDMRDTKHTAAFRMFFEK